MSTAKSQSGTSSAPVSKGQVAKQITKALESKDLSKLEAVDILSVLKRIENLERLTSGKSGTSKTKGSSK